MLKIENRYNAGKEAEHFGFRCQRGADRKAH